MTDTRCSHSAIAAMRCSRLPHDGRLIHRAMTKLVERAKRNCVPLRQSYPRLAKRAGIMVGRYTTLTSSNAPGATSSPTDTAWL